MFKKMMLIGFFAISVVSPISANPDAYLLRTSFVLGGAPWLYGVSKACMDSKFSKKSVIPALIGFGIGIRAGFIIDAKSPKNYSALQTICGVASYASFLSTVSSAGIAAIQFVKSIGMEDDKAQAARKRSEFSGTVAGASVLAFCASIYGLRR